MNGVNGSTQRTILLFLNLIILFLIFFSSYIYHLFAWYLENRLTPNFPLLVYSGAGLCWRVTIKVYARFDLVNTLSA